jgi:hypothetical protein
VLTIETRHPFCPAGLTHKYILYVRTHIYVDTRARVRGMHAPFALLHTAEAELTSFRGGEWMEEKVTGTRPMSPGQELGTGD